MVKLGYISMPHKPAIDSCNVDLHFAIYAHYLGAIGGEPKVD